MCKVGEGGVCENAFIVCLIWNVFCLIKLKLKVAFQVIRLRSPKLINRLTITLIPALIVIVIIVIAIVIVIVIHAGSIW